MSETAMRELAEAAPTAFVNGDATHQQQPTRGPQRVPRGGARRQPAQHRPKQPDAAEGLATAWPVDPHAVISLHEAWRDGIATLAHEQMAFVADACSSVATSVQAIVAEPEPARRMELAWAQTLLQLERSLEASARLMATMGSIGRELLDAAAAGRHRPG